MLGCNSSFFASCPSVHPSHLASNRPTTMTSYIGLHVSLTLTDSPSPLTGHIKAIDGQRNVLVLRPSSSFSSQDVTIDRSRIKAITIVEAQKEQQPAKTSSNNTAPASSSSSAAPFGDGLHSAAPDAGRLPTPNPPKSAKKKARAKKANPQASAVPSSSSNGRSSTGITSATPFWLSV